ncbi:cbl-interacting protein kinase 13 [Hordeum vulgare]|nr:cbl-interacting protein kinase 13 [Hordeum vulgare]
MHVNFRIPAFTVNRQVAFQSTDTGRCFLACAKEKAEEKCCYLEWIDPEWSDAMQFCIGQLWRMHDKENEDRIRDNLKLGEENFKIIGEKRRMEEELRFFKLDFEKMVADKEEAISQLGSARAKAEKERDQLVLEKDQMKEHKKKLEHIISDMMKQNHGYKDKVKKLKEICDEF